MAKIPVGQIRAKVLLKQIPVPAVIIFKALLLKMALYKRVISSKSSIHCYNMLYLRFNRFSHNGKK
jgi:hypothetical protein